MGQRIPNRSTHKWVSANERVSESESEPLPLQERITTTTTSNINTHLFAERIPMGRSNKLLLFSTHASHIHIFVFVSTHTHICRVAFYWPLFIPLQSDCNTYISAVDASKRV